MNLFNSNARSNSSTIRIFAALVVIGTGFSLPAIAATTAPAAVLEAAQAGRSQDLIVLFDDTTVSQDASVMQAAVGSEIATPNILAFKAERFRSIKSRALRVLGSRGISMRRDYSHLPMVVMRIDGPVALQKLISNPDVIGVYEKVLHSHSLMQSLPLISQPAAQSSGKTGAGTTIAVLDTGVNYTLAAFGSCTAPGAPAGCRVAYVQDFALNDNQLDAHGHGTNVAGIVVGVASGARIAALDVFDGAGASNTDIISAINWAIANRATYNITAMNLSLGDSSVNPSECPGSWAATPFQNARQAGIVPVVASGNNGYLNGVSSPACAPGAVRVGAVYDANVGTKAWGACTDSVTAADLVTCFSNSADILTLLAPGSTITAAGIVMSGTSQAAPHVAGAVGVLRASNAFPTDSLDQTITRMQNTGIPVTDHRNGRVTPRLNLGLAAATPNPASDLGWLPAVIDLILE